MSAELSTLTYLSGGCIFIVILVMGIFIIHHFFKVYKFMNEYETQNKTHTHEMNQLVKKHDNDIQKVLAYIKIQGERNIDRDTNINDIQSKVDKNVQDIVGFNFNDLKTKVDKNASDIELMNIDHWKSNVNKNTNDIQNILKLESTFTNNYESNLNKINVINQTMNEVLFLVLANSTTKKLKPGIHHIINENLHLTSSKDGKIYAHNFLKVHLKKGYGIRFIYDKNVKVALKIDPIFLELNVYNLAYFNTCINTYDKFEIFDIAEKMKDMTIQFYIQFFSNDFFVESLICDKKNLINFWEKHSAISGGKPFHLISSIFTNDEIYIIYPIKRNVTYYIYLISGDNITYAFKFTENDTKLLLDKFKDIKDKNFELIKLTDHEL